MRTLVISDVHSNFEALRSVTENVLYDEIIFLGDAINYGPQPLEVLDWIHENVKYRILGNHDNSFLMGQDPNCSLQTRDMALYTMKNITEKLLGNEDKNKLRNFKESIDTKIDGERVLMAHGSPYDDFFGYTYGKEAEIISTDKDLEKFSYILLGHTHTSQ
ncbi:serine/threonine protein phosphatase [mine drainage metagenome]|uniref:Serine/threonine protein phosphatase n=1 Tax=mine drainage metagenome TaxID=410659 RepID=T1BVT6_9ZZZZ